VKLLIISQFNSPIRNRRLKLSETLQWSMEAITPVQLFSLIRRSKQMKFFFKVVSNKNVVCCMEAFLRIKEKSLFRALLMVR